jgi:hypothetical protein
MDRPNKQQLLLIADLLNGTNIEQGREFMELLADESDIRLWTELTDEVITDMFDSTTK